MILASCHVQGTTLTADLGQAETIITQLGFPSHEVGSKPYATSEYARWHLTPTGVEQIEHARNGANLILSVMPTVVLLNQGEPIPGTYHRPKGAARPQLKPA